MQSKRSLTGQRSVLLGVLLVATAGAVSLPAAAESSLVSQQFSWSDILNSLRRDRRDQGGKGELCVLVPGNSRQPIVMWHDRPLFVWRGPEQTIGLRRQGSETVFWRRTVTQSKTMANQLQYVGLALQPGQSYELLLFSSPTANQPVRRQPFVVMSGPDRASLTAVLQTLTTNLKAAGASDEAIAQQRAQVFAEHQLEADVLQEAYSVTQPSAALKQLTTNVVRDRCRSAGSIRP